MPLVNSKDMFKKAYEGGYASGAFNVNNREIVQGIVRCHGGECAADPAVAPVRASMPTTPT